MDLVRELQHYFGYTQFRQGQKEIIADVLNGFDVFGMLATGVGKSTCYLLPGYILNQPVLIVSPLLSLMEDQVNQLRKKGEKRVVAINSFLNLKERKDVLRSLHYYRFIYISPESLQNNEVLFMLKKVKWALFVVDEAHCISGWGHDFRTDYLKISSVHKELDSPPLLALTATATEAVQDDIVKQLQMRNVKKHIYSIDRSNIALSVLHFADEFEKEQYLLKVVKKFKKPGLVYVSSRKKTEQLATLLTRNGIKRVSIYHGGMSSLDRMLIAQQFIQDELDVLVCTNAFGMGINKENIRFIIHYQFPKDIESYMQEIGRAGRDGLQSIALLLYTPLDEQWPLTLIENELPNEQEIKEWFMHYQTSKNIQEVIQKTTLDEVKSRYLVYQAEKEGICNLQGMIRSFPSETFIQNILNEINQRKQLKFIKLKQMKRWIHTEGCYREKLLQPFHQTKKKQALYCCNHCGFSIEAFYESEKMEEVELLNWEKRLAALFHKERGEKHEASRRNH